MNTPDFSLQSAIQTVRSKGDPDGLYVEDLVATFGYRSSAFLVIMLSLPFLQPVPLFGLSTPLGGMIMILGFFIGTGRKIWLPHRLLRKHINFKILDGSCRLMVRTLEKTEKYIKPRWPVFIHNVFFRSFNGLLLFVFAFLLSLPLPIPFSNSVPCYFLIFHCIGQLEGDGLLIFLSYLLAVVCFFFFASLGLGAVELFQLLPLELIHQWVTQTWNTFN